MWITFAGRNHNPTAGMERNRPKILLEANAERATRWIGSTQSLVTHSIIFIVSFILPLVGFVTFDHMLLVLTTLVSLEAIYLSIFIQMSVNKNTADIEVIQEDVEEIQENVEDIQEDVEEIQENVEDIQEDVEDIQENVEDIQEDVEEIQEEIEDLVEEEPVTTQAPETVASDAETIAAIQQTLLQLQKQIDALQKK